MKFKIYTDYFYEKPRYWLSLIINGVYFNGERPYTTRRAAVRGAKRAGGIIEVKED